MMQYTHCEHCGEPLPTRRKPTMRFCTETCRRRAEDVRRAARVKARRKAIADAKAPTPRACKDCGTTTGMDWSSHYLHAGSAGARCHRCYLAYQRAVHHRRMATQVEAGSTAPGAPDHDPNARLDVCTALGLPEGP